MAKSDPKSSTAPIVLGVGVVAALVVFSVVVLQNGSSTTLNTTIAPVETEKKVNKSIDEPDEKSDKEVKKIVYGDTLSVRNYQVKEEEKNTKFKVFLREVPFRGGVYQLYMKIDASEADFSKSDSEDTPLVKAYYDVNFSDNPYSADAPAQYKELDGLVFEDGAIWIPVGMEVGSTMVPNFVTLLMRYRVVVVY